METMHVYDNGAVGYTEGSMDSYLTKVADCPVAGTPYRLTCYATGKGDSFSVPARTRYKGKRVTGHFSFGNGRIFFHPDARFADMFKIRVLFKAEDDSVLAVFPDLMGRIGDVDSMECYAFVGETCHCGAEYAKGLKTVYPDSNVWAKRLYDLLIGRGYHLDVISRMPSNSRKLRKFQDIWG